MKRMTKMALMMKMTATETNTKKKTKSTTKKAILPLEGLPTLGVVLSVQRYAYFGVSHVQRLGRQFDVWDGSVVNLGIIQVWSGEVI